MKDRSSIGVGHRCKIWGSGSCKKVGNPIELHFSAAGSALSLADGVQLRAPNVPAARRSGDSPARTIDCLESIARRCEQNTGCKPILSFFTLSFPHYGFTAIAPGMVLRNRLTLRKTM
jgi:hypothetical protein